jgi:hypothetical protein
MGRLANRRRAFLHGVMDRCRGRIDDRRADGDAIDTVGFE